MNQEVYYDDRFANLNNVFQSKSKSEKLTLINLENPDDFCDALKIDKETIFLNFSENFQIWLKLFGIHDNCFEDHPHIHQGE